MPAWLCGRSSISRSASFKRELQEFRKFKLGEVKSATNSWHPANKIGEGAYSVVFRGKLEDGTEVAVKRLKLGAQPSAAEEAKAVADFEKEVRMLANVRHFRLLRLLGYCTEKGQRVIVTSLVAEGSLHSHLHGSQAARGVLTWAQRVKIAHGVAQGLAALHTRTPPVIHRDVKTGNVLLSEDFSPVLADFGFCRVMPENVTHVNTKVRGTLGYLAPEYALWGEVSVKSDVFSFGILLLELITGRRPLENIPQSKRQRSLLDYVSAILRLGSLEELLDPRIKDPHNPRELLRLVRVAVMCSQRVNVHARPTMMEVVKLLDSPLSQSMDSGMNAIKDSVEIEEEETMLHRLMQQAMPPAPMKSGGTQSRGSLLSRRIPSIPRANRGAPAASDRQTAERQTAVELSRSVSGKLRRWLSKEKNGDDAVVEEKV